jgi:hypothetical protein
MINTNVGALLARTYATRAAERMQTSMERLSSGLRINSAADDAAGLAVANKMQSQLGGIKMAIRNSQDGVSLVQTADGALDEISKLIRRMRELAVQMQNGIYTDKDRSNAQMEIKALLAEVDKIASNTQYNKVNLLDGTYDETIRAGNTNAETIRINIGSLKTADNAIIEAHAVEKAVAGTVAANGTSSALNVTEATSVVVDTSVFSSAFTTFLTLIVLALSALQHMVVVSQMIQPIFQLMRRQEKLQVLEPLTVKLRLVVLPVVTFIPLMLNTVYVAWLQDLLPPMLRK